MSLSQHAEQMDKHMTMNAVLFAIISGELKMTQIGVFYPL